MSDRDGPRATASFSRNWLILFVALLLLGAAAFLVQVVAGPEVAAVITDVGIAVVVLLAVIDGGWRLIGNEGFLGPGTGFDRLLAVFQILLGLAALFGSWL